MTRRFLSTGVWLAIGLLLHTADASAASRRGAAQSVRVDPSTGRLQRMVVTRQLQQPSPTATAGPVLPLIPTAGQPPDVTQIVEGAAQRHAVDPLLVHSVIRTESNYNPKAVSHKGAEGLMQLIPATARRFGAADSFDPQQNIEAGVKYLKHLQALYNNDLTLTLAAYNAGEGAVARYGNSVPPYRETRDYVQKVSRRYESARQKTTAARPAPAASSAESKKAEAVAPSSPSEPVSRPVEQFVGDDGRLYLRTR